MSDQLAVLISALVLVLVFVRQFRARAFSPVFFMWSLIPVAFGVLAPNLIDTANPGPSIALGVVVVAVAAVIGVIYGRTVEVWRDTRGQVWCRATWVAIPIFLGLFVARGIVYAIGDQMGVHTGVGFLLISFSAMMLSRSVIVMLRSGRIRAMVTA